MKLESTARLTHAQIDAMLLVRYNGRALDLDRYDLHCAQQLRRAAREQWARFVGTRVCAACLAEGGSLKVRWKLSVVAACAVHRRLLLDRCTACGAQVGARLARDRLVPKRGRCRCGRPWYEAIESSITANDDLLVAQATVDGWLAAPTAETAATNAMTELRASCTLLLRHAEGEDLGLGPGPELDQFDRYADWRSRGRPACERRRGWPAAATDAPDDCLLAAALLPVAVHLATCDAVELDSHLAKLVGRAHAQGRGRVWQRHLHHQLTPRLVAAWQRASASAPFARTSSRYGLSRVASTLPAKSYTLEARHVPQLLWDDDYHLVRRLLPTVGPRVGRQFAAVALVRVVERCTWQQAVERLDLVDRWGHNMGGRPMTLLLAAGADDEFFGHLRNIAEIRSGLPLTDFGVRRSSLAGWPGIPVAEWIEVARSAGLRRMRADPALPRLAAIRAWASVTGSDDAHCHLRCAGDGRRMIRARPNLDRVSPFLEPFSQNLAATIDERARPSRD